LRLIKKFFKTNSNLVSDEFFEMARFITSSHGNPMLVDSEGRTFQKNTSRNGQISWKCSKYKSLKCLARAKTEGNYVLESAGEHNHIGNVLKPEIQLKEIMLLDE
jgi:hypothetical protein